MDLQLRGRKVIVTGATNGLGRAVAAGLVDEGALVLACGRDTSRAPAGVRAAMSVDVAEPEAGDAIVGTALRELGGVDAIVAAAGQSTGGGVEHTDDDTWARGLDLNLLSVVRLCRAAIPHLRQSDAGRILVFGAVSGIEPRPSHGISNIAKAGIHILTKTLSRELAPEGVLANCIAPGRIRSGQLDRAFADEAARAAHAKDLIPLGRFGQAEEVVPLSLLLVSPRNTYITGQTIAIDGGMSWSI